MFYVIDTNYNELVPYYDAKSVSVYLLGRRLSKYIVIKWDEESNESKLYTPSSTDITTIEKELESL